MPATALTLHRIEGEPRVLDTDLATALGYSVPRDIRKLIKRHAETLATMGTTCATVARVRGQDATVFHLNKPQALFVITKAETTKAVEVTVDMIEKFVAYEAGLVQPKACSLPDFSNQVLMAREWANQMEQRLLAQRQADERAVLLAEQAPATSGYSRPSRAPMTASSRFNLTN